MKLDSKSIVAIIVLIGTFVLLGIPIVQGRIPDPLMIAVVSPLAASVVGFFFGRVNGSAEANLIAVLADRRSNITQIPVQVSPIASPPA